MKSVTFTDKNGDVWTFLLRDGDMFPTAVKNSYGNKSTAEQMDVLMDEILRQREAIEKVKQYLQNPTFG